MDKLWFCAAAFLSFGGIYFMTWKSIYYMGVSIGRFRNTNASWLCFFLALVCVCVGVMNFQ